MSDEQDFAPRKNQPEAKPLSRRDFMRVLSAAASAGPGLVASGLTGLALTRFQRAEAAEVVVAGLGKLPRSPYGTRMGNTLVTPVCICRDWSPDLIAPSLDIGMNFIHKAGYWGASNVPDVIKKLPRDSYYTDITVDNTPRNPDDEDRAYNQVSDSLARNGLKYYDVFRAHFGWQTLRAFNKGANGSYKAFQRLKREGKVKYFGVSQHPYLKYTEMTQALIDSGVIDSIQVQFSYGYAPEIMDIFARASEAGIAMTAMKIYAHGAKRIAADPKRMADLKADNKVGRALIRHVMTAKRADGKPIFHTCVTNLRSMEVFEENVGAVSPRVSVHDGFTLPYA